MGEAGRKLTIRMPDNPRLKSADVGQIHLDPGANVRVGSPVMTLVAGRREHMVRAPRPGRVVPLVANGDQVQAGDPLYILNLDEAALAAAKKGDREIVAVEKAKWAKGITPEVIEPMVRARQHDAADSKQASQIITEWSKPALAIALYILACFALLPILNAFGREASTGGLVAMAIGSVLFGLVIFHLYAPDSGWWPRWTVRMVAISWIGISAMAIFYQQETPDDITLADAAAPLTRLFDPENTVLAPAPDPAPQPPIVLASGVAAGLTDERSTPNHTPPSSVLGDPGLQPVTHAVRVRQWRRANPSNASGNVLVFRQQDLTAPGLGAAPDDQAPAETALASMDQDQALPTSLATMPDLSVFTAIAANANAQDGSAIVAMRLTDVPTEPVADARPPVSLTEDSGPGARLAVALADRADPALRPTTDAAELITWLGSSPVPILESGAPDTPATAPEPTVSNIPDSTTADRQAVQQAFLADRADPGLRPSIQATAVATWLSKAQIPVLNSEAPAAPTTEPEPTLATVPEAAVREPQSSTIAVLDNRADPATRPATDAVESTKWLMLAEVPVLKSDAPNAPQVAPAPAIAAESAAASAERQSVQLATRADAAARPSIDATGSSSTWLAAEAIPVMRSSGKPAPRTLDLGAEAAVASLGPVVAGPAPSLLNRTGDPDLVLVAMLNAARESWMAQQTERVSSLRTESPKARVLPKDQAIVLATSPDAIVQATLAVPSAAGAPGTAGLPGGAGVSGVLPVIEGELLAAAPADLAKPDQLYSTRPGPAGQLASAPRTLDLALAPSTAPQAPPWQPEPTTGLAERDLLFLFYDDPRLTTVPRVGDRWEAAVSQELALAIRSSKVQAVNEVVEVTNWCAAANDPSGTKEATLPGGAYRAAMLSDRIRLLKVRVEVEEAKLRRLEQELPVFNGGPSGFFHNKMPLFGGRPDDAVMAKARAYMQNASNREIDRNTPPGIQGGHYFTSAAEAEAAIKSHGCAFAIWNLGDGPVNEIGRKLAPKLGG